MGAEQRLAEQYLEELRAQLDPQLRVFNDIEFAQKSEPFADAMLKIESVPMLSDKKLVHIKDFHFAQEGNPWTRDQLKQFEETMQRLGADTTLVLSNASVQKAGNLSVFKALSKHMCVIALDRLNQAELMSWMRERVAAQIGSGAIQTPLLNRLIQLSGYLEKNATATLYDVDQMLTKLCSFYREQGKLSDRDLDLLFEAKKEPDLFRLMRCIQSGDKQRAFEEYQMLHEAGEPHIKILITLAKLFSTMVRASYYLEEGYSVEDTAKAMGKNRYAIESGLAFARKHGRSKLIAVIDAIVESDYQMKTGQIGEDVYAQMTLVRIFEILAQ